MQHKKIKYVPGLISLLGLPVLFLILGPEDPEYKNALRLFLPDDSPRENENKFTSGNVIAATKNKKITTIDFWDRHLYEEQEAYIHSRKLRIIKNEIERLSIVHDTNSVLKIELGEGATYGEFVWIINQAIIYNIRKYALVKNSFYIFPNDIPVDPATYESMIVEVDPIFDYIEGPGWWDRFLYDVELQLEILYWYVKYNYLLIAGFVTLIIIPFFVRIKKYRCFIRLESK